jgi:hypothetical protein
MTSRKPVFATVSRWLKQQRGWRLFAALWIYQFLIGIVAVAVPITAIKIYDPAKPVRVPVILGGCTLLAASALSALIMFMRISSRQRQRERK